VALHEGKERRSGKIFFYGECPEGPGSTTIIIGGGECPEG
jgi:hypothetical protein